MPNADQVTDAIEPGSLPYGERAPLTEAMPGLLGPGPLGGGGGSVNPAQMLAAGDLGTSQGAPLTSGLSVGAGNTPTPMEFDDSTSARLRYVAQNAKSPQLRAMARNALRARTRTNRRRANV